MRARTPSGRAATPGAPPVFHGVVEEDVRTLASFTAESETLLSALPGRSLRDAGQQDQAAGILATARAARQSFLSRHADSVYRQLTSNLTRRIRLQELVFDAADQIPGLCPTRAQMSDETACAQADRDGREIDQAIFCAAVLSRPDCGRHLIETMLMPAPGSTELLDTFRDTGRVDLTSVLLERRGRAAYVTFHNPHCLNAENNQLIADLETAVDLALLDDQVRVGVLRGGEVAHPKYAQKRVFSAGIDLKSLRNGAISFVGFLLGRELGYINKIVRGIRHTPTTPTWSDGSVQKPWVGAVDAFAIGGGMQLTLVLDRVIAATDAYFSLPAAEEGIVPGLANLRLTRVTGARLARRIILGGQRIAATDPDARLVCDEVVASEDMPDAIERAVDELSAPAVAANRRMIAVAEEPIDLYRDYLAEFAVAQAVRAYSADVLAKVERRWQLSQSRR